MKIIKRKQLPELAGGETTWEIIENMNHPLKGANDAISITQVKALYKDSASKPLHPELKETIASWLYIIRSCNIFSNLPD